MDGNDVFTGGKGNDIITGGKGNDSLFGGAGANTIEGGEGYDIANADFSDQTGAVVALNLGVVDTKYDFTVGGAKFGSVRNIEMMTELVGGAGDDRLGGVYTLSKQDSTINGGGGTDTAVVDLSTDVTIGFSGGLNKGFIYNNTSGRQLFLTGVEVLEYTGNATGTAFTTGIVGAAGNDILTGLGGNDVFTGAGGDDKISGAAGNDSLAGGTGANTIDGGADFDVASADFSDQTGNVVAVNPGVGGVKYDFTVGGKAHGSVINVEMMTGLVGGNGNDRLGGVYTLTSLDVTIAGGDGTDTAVVDLSADIKGSYSGGPGDKLIYNNITGRRITLTDMEVLEFIGNATGTAFATGIVGGDFNDILTGLDGNDVFTGGKGHDIITGGKGNDSLAGGTGANTMEGGEGYDIASADFSDQTGAVVALNLGVVDTKYDFTVGGAKFGSVRNVEMMTGLVGGTGNDRLGGVYTTTSLTSAIIGGDGTDTAVVDLSADTAGKFSGSLAAGLIYNNITGRQVTLTGIEVLEFTGNAISGAFANGIVGGGGTDILTGLGKADIFRGGGGNDRIRGNGGDDQLFGDAGDDMAVFGGNFASYAFSFTSATVVKVSGPDGNDTLTNFEILRFDDGEAEMIGGVIGNSFTITPATVNAAEGQSGATPFVFTVTRTGLGLTKQSIGWSVAGAAGGGTTLASGADFVGGVLPTGMVTFLPGSNSETVTVALQGDTAVETNDRFAISLVNAPIAATIVPSTAQGVILNDDATLSISALAASKAEGNAGTTALTFTVTRGGDTSVGHSVNFAVTGSGGAPAVAADFAGGVLPGGTVNFAAGETSRIITVNVAGDTVVESDEGFTVTLSAPPSGAVLGAATVGGTILNDDAQLSIAALAASKAEGNAATTALTFTVTRTGDTSVGHSASFAVTGSGGAAADAADFAGNALPNGTVSFAAGETSRIMTINVAGDTKVESDEGFTITLSAPSAGATLGTAAALGTIVNDDTLSTATLSIAALAASKAEGNAGTTALTFTVTRTGDTLIGHSASFAVTGSGGAPAAAADFAGNALPNGTVNFAAGETSKVVTINVAGDTLVESDEGLTVTLSAPSSGAVLGTATAAGTILNDDAPGTGTLSIARVQAARGEGQAGSTPFTFVVTRSGDKSGEASASWAATGGGVGGTVAVNGADFTGGVLPSGVVSFAANETSKTLTLNIAGDTAVELNESFTVTLADPMIGVSLDTATATGTVFNDDTAGSGTLSIARATAQRAEGTGAATPFTFTVTRSGDSSATAGADWAVTGGGVSNTNAANAADFANGILPSGRVNFGAGQTSMTVTVSVAGDAAIELNEGFTVTLAAPQLGVAIGTAAATGTILNDDFPPTGVLSIARLNASRSEGQSGTTAFTFVVTRSGVTTGPASANWAVTGGGVSNTNAANAADFANLVLPSGTVSLAPGQTSKVVTVEVAGDVVVELNESFTVTLSDPPAGVSIGIASASGVMWNDDTPGTGTLSIARASAVKPEGDSGVTPYTFTVTRTGDLSGTAGVDLLVTGGGAANTGSSGASDFEGGQFPARHIAFAPNQSVIEVTVPVLGDTKFGLNESFTVTLSGPQLGVAIDVASAIGVVLDDDTLVSTSASETLTGTADRDQFLLGGGVDTVFGLAGMDLFRFRPSALGTAATNATTMEDFSRADGEKLDLTAIDAIAGTVFNDTFSFIGTAAFNGTAGQLRWEDLGGLRMIQGNVNTDTIADLTIFVRAPGPVDANWFLL